MDTKQQLRQIFRTMEPNRGQEIREAYYKAIEGLMTLARELELADADLADSTTPLLDEHKVLRSYGRHGIPTQTHVRRAHAETDCQGRP